MAMEIVQGRTIPIGLACKIFTISQSCCRYQAKNNAENDGIANWLLRLTDNHRNWGFGLFFVPAQCQRVSLEPQACVSHLS
jgi:putative transposase